MIDWRRHAVFGVVYFVLAAMATAWALFGRQIVADAYRGTSFDVLNRVIVGQATHPIEYYQRLADHAMAQALGLTLFAAIGGHVAGVVDSAYRSRRLGRRAALTVGLLCLAFTLSPPVFSRLFAVGLLRSVEATGLWSVSAICVFASLLVHRVPSRLLHASTAVALGMTCLLAAELIFRAFVNFSPATRTQLARLAEQTYPDTMRYRAHPFLQFTGTPRDALAPSHLREADDLPRRYNSFGFVGPEFRYHKLPDTLRIACLGGSTTESGYPRFLEEFLRARLPARPVEVMNFGLAAYTSAHSVVNFVLNVRDFSPDVVVIHDGWNDGRQRPVSGANRGDYSLTLGPFRPGASPDRHVVRLSALYRFVRHRVVPQPDYLMLENATSASADEQLPPRVLDDADRTRQGWSPFERNLRTILDLCRIDKRLVVLATMPHRRRPEDLSSAAVVAMGENNLIVRRLAVEYSDTALLVDLDRALTEKDNAMFTDLGHVTVEGNRRKALEIARALLDRLSAARPTAASKP